ncbi:SMI1/KNR4 family protein [Klugiella xanthotipulae]|uniref:SMI1/KNR4 family protein n=1 Tax=Klugiella xanthotipulae TaxID=244735 RepID=UPI00147690DB|nr:SMI1/KNR4 family protein [Klugiella xanthotipulae]
MATKQALAAGDPEGIFPYHLPEVAASEEAIATAERALHITFDHEYRNFLTFAGGWKGFHQSVSLLTTTELVSGPLRDSACEAFEAMPELLEDLGWSPENLLPIAATLEDVDIFLMKIGGGGVSESQVYWVAEGELIDTFETFSHFFVSIIDHTKRRIIKMQE